VLAVVRVRHARLGGEDDVGAAVLQEAGQHLLGGSADVGVGGVDGGDAGGQRLIHHAAGGGLIDGVAEGHGAQDQPGDRECQAVHWGAFGLDAHALIPRGCCDR
jgi:hypothetical protein